jgi:Ser/Thr protein kinase RdoA (MazF antagonist)
MIRILHHIPSDELAAVYPLPAMHHLPLWEFGTLLHNLDADVPTDARTAMIEAVKRLDRRHEWTDVVACHGDVHPGNVLQTRQGPVLADWDLMCRAPRSLDHAVVMRWPDRYGGEPDMYRQFARGYGWSAVDDGVAQALGELRLLAATLLRLRATVPNGPGRQEALRRCRYWTDGARASRWTPQ